MFSNELAVPQTILKCFPVCANASIVSSKCLIEYLNTVTSELPDQDDEHGVDYHDAVEQCEAAGEAGAGTVPSVPAPIIIS